MALMPRLRQLMRRPTSASTVGTRRPRSGEKRGDTVHEDALRAMLVDDPNDERAFRALAELVRRRAAEGPATDDPLAAPVDETEKQRAADLAVWALAEELAGHPKGWYPLVELGRLSLDDDQESALRRFATAAERDPSGRALAQSMEVLRAAGLPAEALGLGVGHWRARDHDPEVGRQLVLAAIESDRPLEARHHLASLVEHGDPQGVATLRTDLERAVAQAEQHRAGT
ncbi:hypothetical protein [Cellulosimicrobium composti]|uniref:Uncharacterized protein n=1 Tax=Cellulosimicrobium composti TaxID=2672572 RepID=A0A6N7ZMX5_9MICO|nr:hypothetical protein [Cellulosimicrobium composti]MTG90831.1 hypothetical protein [Cellulosimicrobium composti]NDO91152.1 hypothetical protein [Cellulosimicrobium composti]TWG77149.1 hypothetical protein L603_005400000080 [Cellulosimicrobium cellulans J34]SMF53293.1 hypothetical protein SAMN02744115_03768 [Cellulosimicrobium cellulans J1]